MIITDGSTYYDADYIVGVSTYISKLEGCKVYGYVVGREPIIFEFNNLFEAFLLKYAILYDIALRNGNSTNKAILMIQKECSKNNIDFEKVNKSLFRIYNISLGRVKNE